MELGLILMMLMPNSLTKGQLHSKNKLSSDERARKMKKNNEPSLT